MVVGSNPLIQVTPGLMIWTIVCFLIALYVLKRYAFGPIQKLIDERQQRIRRALEEADAQRRRVKEEAEADRQRRLDETSRQIDAETRRALEAIRAEVAELSLIAAEKVTRGALDDKDQRRLIDEAIGDLDFSVLTRND